MTTWTVVRRLGRGATGVVELVAGGDGRLVARKRLALHGSAAELRDARHRTRREADVLRRDHPAIVPLLDIGYIDGDGVPATAKVGDPNCLFDVGGGYVAEVSVVSGNSATDYELTRAGSL